SPHCLQSIASSTSCRSSLTVPLSLRRSGRSVSRCERSPAIMPPWVVGPWMALVLLVCTGAEPIPRITFQRGDPTRSVNVFHRSDIQHYDRLLLSEDKGTLYVGARDHILAFSTRDPTNIQLTGE
ncbi:hypothetical protein GDO81_029096, partial [Engystomops pustulosus]